MLALMTARQQPPAFARMAADPLRWQLLTELGRTDRRVRELVALAAQPQSLVSYHLHQLRRSGLVTARRSSLDGRDVYYHLDLAACAGSLAEAGTALHPGLAPAAPAGVRPAGPGPRGRPALLFLCTGNSARSQIAEALARKRSRGRVRAWSAGSNPKPVHPNTARAMARYGIDAAGWQSKHFAEFTTRRFDAVITLCDKVREVCPLFPGNPRYIHWSIPDPAAAGSSDDATLPAFHATAADISTRIGYLLAAISTPPGQTAETDSLPTPT